MSTGADGPCALADIDVLLDARDRKEQLRFVICGSVDDGKSTLPGRLLHDSKAVFEDQLSAAEAESRTYGTQGDTVDLALLVDGLQAEREQGITVVDHRGPVAQKLHMRGMHTYLLDGDNVRHGLNNDLGFTDKDRVESIRRVAEVAKLMVDAGLVVIVFFISRFRYECRTVRDLMEEGQFLERFVDATFRVCGACASRRASTPGRPGAVS